MLLILKWAIRSVYKPRGGVNDLRGSERPWKKKRISLIIFVIVLVRASSNNEKFNNNVVKSYSIKRLKTES